MPIHTIRLSNPWLLPDAPQHPAAEHRVRLPASQGTPDQQKNGPFALLRRFHSPTGLSEATTVRIRLDVAAARPELLLNGQLVPPELHEPVAASPDQHRFWFTVTTLLKHFNAAVVTLLPANPENTANHPTLLDAALLIEEQE